MVRASRPRCGDRLDRTAGRGDRGDGKQDGREDARGRCRSSGGSGNDRTPREREGSREDREEVRLSGAAEGRGGRWGKGDAGGFSAEGAGGRARSGAKGSEERVRRRRSVSGEIRG